jgi:hypothetical protein
MNFNDSFIPVPSKINPYTYIDTLKDFHPDIWEQAESLISEINSTFNLTAEDRR